MSWIFGMNPASAKPQSLAPSSSPSTSSSLKKEVDVPSSQKPQPVQFGSPIAVNDDADSITTLQKAINDAVTKAVEKVSEHSRLQTKALQELMERQIKQLETRIKAVESEQHKTAEKQKKIVKETIAAKFKAKCATMGTKFDEFITNQPKKFSVYCGLAGVVAGWCLGIVRRRVAASRYIKYIKPARPLFEIYRHRIHYPLKHIPPTLRKFIIFGYFPIIITFLVLDFMLFIKYRERNYSRELERRIASF